MTTGQKLAVGGVIITLAVGLVAYRGATSSWQYYLTVDECRGDLSSFAGRPVRVSGRVARGSLAISANRSQASFRLAGNESELEVVAAGPLPDNLAEDMEIVVEGKLDGCGGKLDGRKVLTRCSSKYESKRADAVARRPNVGGRELR